MQRNHKISTRSRRRTGGFTLLELLIAITIIGIMAGLLIPAIQSARQTARIAQCRADIADLAKALEAFKTKYGEYPPSRITLYHNNTTWNDTSDQEVQRSRRIIRRFWPKFNFAATTYPWSTTVELRGAECLVFFLGGMARSGSDWKDLIGFSNNPASPFDRSATSRSPSFFEFKPDRLNNAYTDSANSTIGYTFLNYVDTLPGQDTPYLYANSDDGSGYATDDVKSTSSMLNQNRLSTSAYQSSASGTYWNKNTFQIISPGFDHQFGVGGLWNEATADTDLVGTRSVERDNLTNFHTSTLASN
ncbi:MAG: prepilin-type N-terminal cleavage/methylation domain-containing protein [Planctomycetaceae bacterium]|nr:prepilin-type N-terminal cleavage/methylation domain-containing protein [Planctomycetaceae bacterium]